MYNEKFNITNIVNYVRKSRRDEEKERRTGEDTLAEQTKLMQRVLNDMGIPYIQLMEVGSGDKIETRPVFKQVIEELRQRKYDAIAVKEISRLGRGSYTDMGVIYDMLQEYRIYIITPWKIYDPRNNADLRQIRFELFMAREEFETIRERLVGARYSSAMEGKWMGNVPYGYYRDKQTMRLVPVPEEAMVVKQIYDLYVNQGLGFKSIATYLKANGIQSPKGNDFWDTTQLRRTLENSAYIGTASYRIYHKVGGKMVERPKAEQIVVQDAHEPIIDEKMFYEAIQRRVDRKKLPNRFDVDVSELTGVLECTDCGRNMVINSYQRKRRSGSVYLDKYVRCRNGCTTVKYEVALEAIEKLLGYLTTLDNDKLQEHIVAYELELSKQQREAVDRSQEVRRAVENRRKELENNLKVAMTKNINGVWSDEIFLQFKHQYDADMTAVAEMERSLLEAGATSEKGIAKENIVKVSDLYKTLNTPEEKNSLLRKTFHHITLKVLEKGTKTKKPKLQLEPSILYEILRPTN